MSCSSCTPSPPAPSGRGSASFPMQQCPSRMSDGRSFTDYSSSKCNFTYSKYGATSYDSRMYMIHNADEVIRQQRAASMESVCLAPPGLVPVPAEQFVVRCTPETCSRDSAAGLTPAGTPAGLGDGRRYYS